MQICSPRSLPFNSLVLLGLLVLGRHAAGQTTNQWTNTVSGAWGNGANWSANQPPSSGFSYTVISNAGTKTVTIDSSTSGGALSIDRLRLSAPAGSTNTLLLTGLTVNKPLQASGSVVVSLGGIVALTNSALGSVGLTLDNGAALNITNSTVTENGIAPFDIINGTAWLESGLLDCSAIQTVRIGRTNNATGTLSVHGGTMLAKDIDVGTTLAAPGTLAVSGGTVNASGVITVGSGGSSTGTVAVTAGQLIATNDVTYVGKGNNSFGEITISGGNATFAFLSVGNSSDGLLTVSGGQVTLKPKTATDWLQIGNTGNGQFNMTGGTLLSGGEVHVGDDSSGNFTGSGVANITGGQLIATNDQTAIGRYGPGQLTVSNATVLLTNVSVGRHGGAVGTFNVQSNAQVFLLDALSIGRFEEPAGRAVGHVLVTGGLLSLTNDTIWVGREGNGDLTVSNGIVAARAMFVGVAPEVTNTPYGSVTLAGGLTQLSSNLLVGTSTISTGQVLIVGGSLTIARSANSAYLSVDSGNFTLSQGTLTTDNLFLTNSTGQFVFNGGTLQAKAAVVANGLPFVVGDGVHPATFQLLGGTYSFANGLVISANATVTGCGTIVGTISNSGTLATNCPSAGVSITSLTKAGAVATISFTTLAGSNHVLEFKNSLADSVWTPIPPGVIGNGGVTNQTDPNATVPRRFYRVHLQ